MSSDRMCCQSVCRVYEIIVITTKKAVISKLPYYMREINVGNFNWTDGSAVWGMSSRITYTMLIHEVLITIAVNVIWQHSFQLPTMVRYYVYDHISSQPPLLQHAVTYKTSVNIKHTMNSYMYAHII